MKSARNLVTTLLLVAASSQASAEVCRVVNGAVKTVAAGLGAQALMAAAPVTVVAHSSGGLILTGASGYLAHTLGVVGTAWAVATAPVTIVVTAGAVVTGATAVAVCNQLRKR